MDVVKSLLDVDLKSILEAVRRKSGIELPDKVIEVSLVRGVLHMRFDYPKGPETDVEPLPFKTPVFLFRDEKTDKITALEIVGVEELLEEIGDRDNTSP